MAGTDKRKQSLYFPEDMLNEIQAEANRQDRSLSWIVQQAWRIARGEIMRFPSVNDVLSGVAREDERGDRRELQGDGARRLAAAAELVRELGRSLVAELVRRNHRVVLVGPCLGHLAGGGQEERRG